ncbi:unnamed protein product [Lota lota]
MLPSPAKSETKAWLSSNQSRASGVRRLQRQAPATREQQGANCPQILILLQSHIGQGGEGREYQAHLLNTKPPEVRKMEAGKERKHIPNLTY